MKLQAEDLRLYIYGAGEMEAEMSDYMKMDSRIIYHGVVLNRIVVDQEIKSTLLINPRLSKEEFSRFSFPSKNMEYMVSGTPVLTTVLPGMPKDYHDYIYKFNDETSVGMGKTLESILNKSKEELHDFGLKSKKFVLENKNNKVQASILLKLCFQDLS